MANLASQRRRTTLNGNSFGNQDGTSDSPSNIFSDNRNRTINNPFKEMESSEVAEQCGHDFAKANELDEYADLFGRAGRVLHDPEGFRDPENRLEKDELAALELEIRPKTQIWQSFWNSVRRRGEWKTFWSELFPTTGFWHQPKQLRSTIIMLSWAAIVQGWCQASSNGANLNWANDLLGQPPDLEQNANCDPTGRRAWIFSVVNAAPYLAASIIGCWLSDPLSERLLGRRAPIAISTIAIIASAIGSGLIQKPHWPQLLVCRIILGLGMGTKAAIVPVFAAEIAPAHLRGSLVMNWQLFDALGIFAGFTANIIAATIGAGAWRWQFAAAALPALILIGQIYATPESPRFLMKQGKFVAAYDALKALRGHQFLAATELLNTYEQMKIEMDLLSPRLQRQDVERLHVGPSTSFPMAIGVIRKMITIFIVPRTRRALFAAWVVMASQQLCGINVLIFYSSTVYGDLSNACGQADVTHPIQHLRPLFLSWGIGLTNFLFAFPAYWLIDRRGRRFLLLTTLPFMALFMLAAGLSFRIPNSSGHNPAYGIVIGVFTYVFVALYSVGMGPVPFTYSAECFPLEVRMVGMSLAVSANFLGAGLLALFVPVLTSAIGHLRLLVIFSALNIVAFVLTFLFLRETSEAAVRSDRTKSDKRSNAMSLEDLNYAFGVKTLDHVRYQFEEVLRDYFIKRYILRRPENSKVNDNRAMNSRWGWKKPKKFYIWAGSKTARKDTGDPDRKQSATESVTDEKHEISPYVQDTNAERINQSLDMTTSTSIFTNRQDSITDNTNIGRRQASSAREHSITQSGRALPSGTIFWQIMENVHTRLASLEAGRQ